MKKHLFTAFISILMIFVIAGCSTSGSSNQTASNGNKGSSQKADVYGEVSAINGNKVTLKLMKMPRMNKPKGQVRGSGTGNMGVQSTPPNNGKPGQENGGMNPRTYTGKQKTITIPDGVQMTEITRGADGVEKNTITLDQITPGSILSVYYDQDGKTIKSIGVQQPMPENSQTGNTAS